MNTNSNTIMLLCPFCVKEGKTNPVETPKHSVFVPALFDHYIPPWERSKGFVSLIKAAELRPEFRALIKEGRNGKKLAVYICREHLKVISDKALEKQLGFRLFTQSLLKVEERKLKKQEAQAQKNLGLLSSLLPPEEQAALLKVAENADQQEIQAAVNETVEPNPPYQGPEVGLSTRSRRGSLKIKEASVAEGKGHKPKARTSKGGQGKNLANRKKREEDEELNPTI